MKKGSHHTKESNEKNRLAQIDKHVGILVREKNGMFGKHHTEESNEKNRQSHLGKPSPFKGKHHTEETLNKMKGRELSEEHCQNISIALKGILAGEKHPLYGKTGEKSPNWGKNRKEESKQLQKQKAKERWQDEEFVNKITKSLNIKPTKPEWILGTLLDGLFPGEYQYSGDFSFWIGGKNPDFLNINGQKKIIELFGDYWHSPEIVGKSIINQCLERIYHFNKYGYKTLIIWEKDLNLKNIPKLKQDLMKNCIEYKNDNL